MYYKVVFSAALLVLTGCSSVPPPAQTEETVAQTSDPSSSQPAKKEQLSAGKSVTITTSQGEINVAPAVVLETEKATRATENRKGNAKP